MKLRLAFALVAALSCLTTLSAGQTAGVTSVSVPPVIQFSNVATDESGTPLSGTVSITFSLYNSSQGGQALWTETQNLQLGNEGQYSAYLGLTQANGLPTNLFTSGRAQWLGVKIESQPEQARVFLVSVPYAMKAGDAATVGGLPPSAFVMAASTTGSSTSTATASDSSASANSSLPPNGAITGSGTVDFLPLWDTTSDIISSVLFQSGSGSTAKIGINTTTPTATLSVKGTTALAGATTVQGALTLPAGGTATASGGKNSQPITQAASAFNSSTSTSVNQTFEWQAEPVNNDTSSASGTLNLLFGQGTSKPAETGLHISSNGQIAFASGQTFPGTGDGTITGVTAGTGLNGGGSSGSVTLTNTGILGLTAGTGVSITSGQSPTVGVNTAQVPLLTSANTFTENQTVNGAVSATNGFQIGTNYFDYGSATAQNAFLGFAGNFAIGSGGGTDNTAVGWRALLSSTGNYNTASGWDALVTNSTGSYNTGYGYEALNDNTTGTENTAVGGSALVYNTTGSLDTSIGYYANVDATTPNLTNATAIGAFADVTKSNSLVLGSIFGTNLCNASNNCASVNVGIGTTAPAYSLDVSGTGHFTQAVTFGSPVNFASGQTFPGAGTITGITAGNGLSGGGSTGSVTMTNTGILALAAGTGVSLTSGQSPTVSVNTTQVPLLSSANTFTNSQTVNGNLTATGVISGSSFQIGSTLFGYGSIALGNAFLGFAGNTTTSGSDNTATGLRALLLNSAGNDNTAIGEDALELNTTGTSNTGVGASALFNNTSGSFNVGVGYVAGQPLDHSNTTANNDTFLGAGSAASTGALSNATAVGSNSEVTESNALVLGSINGVNSATASVNVGIGTTSPQYTLHVVDNGSGAAGIGAVSSIVGDNAVYGANTATSGAGTNGGYFSTASPLGSAVVGVNTASGGLAAFFEGNVTVTGTLSKGGGSFKIDHPLDPANKYLYHSFVESPDMMDVYNGNATTDKHGLAVVILPDYFEALNRDFRYQLTVIGQFAQAIVLRKVSNNQFTIKTNRPGVEVSWQVTGIRQDAYANAHRIPTEEMKPPQEQGRYLHPELFGAPPEQAVGYRVPAQPAMGASEIAATTRK